MILSIIIPVYNVELYLNKCVLSTQIQDISPSDYEVILINDGSLDDSLKIAEKLALKYENVSVYSQANQGLSAARNAGMRIAKGDYYMFIDSDDWIEENCLGRIVSLLTDDIDELVIGGDNVTDIDYKFISSRCLYPDYHLQTLTGIETWEKGIARKSAAVFTIYRRQFLLDNDLYFLEGIYHEDNEFCPRASYLSKSTKYLSDVIYHVRQNPTSITRTHKAKKAYDNILVVQRLSLFCEEYVREDLKILFYQNASLLINNAFNEISHCSTSEIKKFETYFLKTDVLPLLLNSKKIQYVFEWAIIKMFPQPIKIYRFLKQLSSFI